MKLEKKIAEWSDEECLLNFGKFFERVSVTTQFIQDPQGLLTHQIITMVCGDKILLSEPSELEWPLQPLPMPEAFKDKMN